MLGLRLNHPAAQDGLELRPLQAITRAEAAYSFAQLLTLDEPTLESVQAAADAFTLPVFTPWQQRVLTTAIHYVGYPVRLGRHEPRARDAVRRPARAADSTAQGSCGASTS